MGPEMDVETQRPRGAIIGAVGAGSAPTPHRPNAIINEHQRINGHNDRLREIGELLDQLVGSLPQDTGSKEAGTRLGGDIGEMQMAIDLQDVLIHRLESQLRRLLEAS